MYNEPVRLAVWLILVAAALFVPSSVAGREQRIEHHEVWVRENQAEAFARLKQQCERYGAFLQCRVPGRATKHSNRNTGTDLEDGSPYMMFAGSFGAGVVADVDLTKLANTNVRLYRDGQVVTSGSADSLQVQLAAQCVSPAPAGKIAVFLKTGQFSKLRKTQVRQRQPELSPFANEQARSRVLVGLGIAPGIFDLITNVEFAPAVASNGAGSLVGPPFVASSDPGFQGPRLLLGADYMLMEYFDGVSASRVMSTLMKRVAHASSSKNAPLLRTCLRSALRLMHATFATLEALWAHSYRHCDAHAGNVVLLRQSISVNDPGFVAGFDEGKFIIAGDGNISEYEALLPAAELQAALLGTGRFFTEAYLFERPYMRIIDLAYLTRLTTPDAAMPCRSVSADRREDLVEMARLVVAFTTGVERVSPSVVSRRKNRRSNSGVAEAAEIARETSEKLLAVPEVVACMRAAAPRAGAGGDDFAKRLARHGRRSPSSTPGGWRKLRTGRKSRSRVGGEADPGGDCTAQAELIGVAKWYEILQESLALLAG